MNFYKIGNGNKVILSDDATDLEWAVAKEKARRNNYLAESDWTQVTDNGMSCRWYIWMDIERWRISCST